MAETICRFQWRRGLKKYAGQKAAIFLTDTANFSQKIFRVLKISILSLNFLQMGAKALTFAFLDETFSDMSSCLKIFVQNFPTAQNLGWSISSPGQDANDCLVE